MRGTAAARARRRHALRRRRRPASISGAAAARSRDRKMSRAHEGGARRRLDANLAMPSGLALSAAAISAMATPARHARGARRPPASRRAFPTRPARVLAEAKRSPRRPPRRFLRRPVRRDGDHAARAPDPTTARALGRGRDGARSRARVRDARGGRRARNHARARIAPTSNPLEAPTPRVVAAERRAGGRPRLDGARALELRRVRETFRRGAAARDVTRDLERARAAAADRDSKVMDAVRQRDDARRGGQVRVAPRTRAGGGDGARRRRRRPASSARSWRSARRRRSWRTRRERTRTRGEERDAALEERDAGAVRLEERAYAARGGRTQEEKLEEASGRRRGCVCAWRRSRGAP